MRVARLCALEFSPAKAHRVSGSPSSVDARQTRRTHRHSPSTLGCLCLPGGRHSSDLIRFGPHRLIGRHGGHFTCFQQQDGMLVPRAVHLAARAGLDSNCYCTSTIAAAR